MSEKLELPKECQGCPVAEALKAALLNYQLDLTTEKLLDILSSIEKDYCCQKGQKNKEIKPTPTETH